MKVIIKGSGSYIPNVVVKNTDFLNHQFLNEDGSDFATDTTTIAEKFMSITGIEERRYATNDLQTSDLAFLAAQKAIAAAGINAEDLDYIIVAHNFGNVSHGACQSDILPSLAARVKHSLQIKNSNCVAYDLLFGCPGWIEGVIQAYAFIQAKMAQNCLVIGAETLSRVVDVHDRDSMIYADGAGATVISASSGIDSGILAHQTASFTEEEAYFLFFGTSYNKNSTENTRYIKMHGRKIYEFALNQVPLAMKACLDKSGKTIADVAKILIHQANEKMDEAIVKRFYKLYAQTPPKDIMPMSIHKLGNSSVATIPTLLDLLVSGQLDGHTLQKGEVILLASVGAGMNINAIVYQY